MIAVSWSPSRYKRGMIALNGEPWREIAISLLKKHSFLEGYPSMEEWLSAWNEWENKQAKLKAYEKLSRKRYFVKELKTALQEYGFSPSVIEDVVKQMVKAGYLNDQEGIESYLNRGIKQKKSPAWVKNKLRQKGIVDLEVSYPKEVRDSIIKELLQKYKGKNPIAAIARRGFSLEEILSVYRSDNKF